MTAVQPANGHLVEPTEWPFAAPTLVVPAIKAFEADYFIPPANSAAQSVGGGMPAAVEHGSDPMQRSAESDDDLGAILLRVQRFASETELQVKREAEMILESARTEARLIIAGAEQNVPTVISSAREEARRIIEEASGQASQQAGDIIESARAEARRIVEQARDAATLHAPQITAAGREEAQRTIQQAKQQATLHAREIVESARSEAQRIVEEATQVALAKTMNNQSGVSREAVANLTASIKEFAETNTSLVEELFRLRDSLPTLQTAQTEVGVQSSVHVGQSSHDEQLWGDLRGFGIPTNDVV